MKKAYIDWEEIKENDFDTYLDMLIVASDEKEFERTATFKYYYYLQVAELYKTQGEKGIDEAYEQAEHEAECNAEGYFDYYNYYSKIALTNYATALACRDFRDDQVGGVVEW